MITNSLYEHYQKDVIPQLKEKRGAKIRDIPKKEAKELCS